MKRIFFVAASILMALTAASCATFSPASMVSAEGSFERTLTVTGPVSLDAFTSSGSIAVHPGGDGTVHVVGRIRAYSRWWAWTGISAEEAVSRIEQDPPVDQNGNVIRVGYLHDPELGRSVSLSYEVTVPATTQAQVRISSGPATIDGIRGPVDASTSSGSLTISNVGGPVDANVSSGSITLQSISSYTSAACSSGFIRGTDLNGANVRDQSGTVTLGQVRGPLHAYVSSGSISVEGVPAAPWHLHNNSGGISIHVPPPSGFDVGASVTSGAVRNSLPMTSTTIQTGNALAGKVNGGGPLVQIDVLSGWISIN